MKKIVIYWSGTGQTKAIAEKIAQDADALMFNVSEITPNEALSNDVIILGCPAMGDEELEEFEFKPFYDELIKNASGKKIFLFGSYGWGDGSWMRSWQDDVLANGCNLGHDGLIVCGGEDEIDLAAYDEFISKINE